MSNSQLKTIYSLSSGAGLAGVAVIRVSGPEAENSIGQMCGMECVPRQASLRKIIHPQSGDVLDQGIVIWFPGPKTFTGEDIVEFQIHGGHATVSAVLEGLSCLENFEQAEAGEFTRRAFMNGRLDLIEVEGLGDLLNAQTEAQRRQALKQSEGAASRVFEGWRTEIISILGYLEASIDFIEEEDVDGRALDGMMNKLIHLRNDMENHLSQSTRGERVRGGVRVALMGEPNVGKSSILNYLARRDVAIVSDIPGTTRDVLEVHLDLNGLPVTFSDTAGLRKNAGDEIELEGMKRARAAGELADLILWIKTDSSETAMNDKLSTAMQIKVANKTDLGTQVQDSDIAVSAKTGEGMDRLLDLVTEKVEKAFGGREPALITRERQRNALQNSVSHLSVAIKESNIALELTTEQVRLAATELARLVGRIDVEDLLDVIFRDFCVGK